MTVSVSGLERIASGQDEEKIFEDLTQHEIVALRTQHDLADAHTHQKQSRSQRDIVESLPTLWFEAEQKSQRHFDRPCEALAIWWSDFLLPVSRPLAGVPQHGVWRPRLGR
jgi:hypothetical protein